MNVNTDGLLPAVTHIQCLVLRALFTTSTLAFQILMSYEIYTQTNKLSY